VAAREREPGRFVRYVYSTRNVAGCALALLGPGLGLVGVVSPLVGLAVAPALYTVGALAAPGHRPVDLAKGVDPDDIRRSLVELQRRVRGKVPPEVDARVDRILTTITETLPKADGLGLGSPELFALVRTATDYLPGALQVYLNLPRAYADRHVVAEGKTALGLLCDQLDLLATKMDEVADAVHRADTDKLIAHGRFLADRFGTGTLDLRRPRRPSPPA
jgi:hypothetical protein